MTAIAKKELPKSIILTFRNWCARRSPVTRYDYGAVRSWGDKCGCALDQFAERYGIGWYDIIEQTDDGGRCDTIAMQPPWTFGSLVKRLDKELTTKAHNANELKLASTGKPWAERK